MKWTVRQEKLIKAVIRHERKCLGKKDYISSFWSRRTCPFCLVYDCCVCPNVKLSKLLGLSGSCLTNFKHMFNLMYFYAADINDRNIKLRIQWWKDALKMTEGQFKEKYGKE